MRGSRENFSHFWSTMLVSESTEDVCGSVSGLFRICYAYDLFNQESGFCWAQDLRSPSILFIQFIYFLQQHRSNSYALKKKQRKKNSYKVGERERDENR